MFGSDFWNRANIQAVCEFIWNGDSGCSQEPGTAQERYKRLCDEHIAGVRSFRDNVLAHDWESCKDEHEKNVVTDRLWTDALIASGQLEKLAFEVGARVGLLMGRELYQE